MAKLILFTFALVVMQARAEIVTETIEYKAGDAVLQGYIAYDAKLAAKRPGIVVVHDWMGMGPFVKKFAEELAGLGYTAIAADIYGKDVKVKDAKEASAMAGKFKGDRKLLRERAQAALNTVRAHKTVDPKRLAALGFCFGGTTALELARSGAPLRGAISFHGNLDTPNAADAKQIQGDVLVLHGADDPYVPAKDVAAFEKEMKDAKVRYQFEQYPGAVHSFTNPEAGTDNSKGAAYNAEADQKSRSTMKIFLSRVFKLKP